MDNVFDIGSGEPVEVPSSEPGADEQWMSDYIEYHLGDLQAAFGALSAANEPDEFRQALAEVKRVVKGLP